MNLRRRSASVTNVATTILAFAPKLEILEDRLPPGDAVLGTIWGTSILMGDSCSSVAEIDPSQPTDAVGKIVPLPASDKIFARAREEQTDDATDTSNAARLELTFALPLGVVREAISDPLSGGNPRVQAAQRTRLSSQIVSAAKPQSTSTALTDELGQATRRSQSVATGSSAMVGADPIQRTQVPLIRDTGGNELGKPIPLFAEGTNSDYIESTYQHISRLWGTGTKYDLGPRWSGAEGSARALTWSLVPDGLNIPNGIGEGAAPSELFSRMDSLFASQGGRPTWINRITQSLNRWTELSGVTYTQITFGGNDWDDGASWGSAGSATRGDIRISMKNIDGGSGTLAYNSFPSQGDMVLDRSESWASSSNSHRFMRNTVMHENGHGLGLDHVCSNNAGFLMEPILSTSFDGPRHDDIRAMQRHYGDPFEDDNTAATATDIGALVSGVPVNNVTDIPPPLTGTNPTSTSNASIDADGEQDYYRFSVADPSHISLTVTPLGFTYNDNVQNFNGTCQTANSTNSLTRANLDVQLIGSDGNTVLATADTQATGLPESIGGASVGAGTYYIRVYEGDSPTQSQMYTFSVTAVAKPDRNPVVPNEDPVGPPTALP